jgi:sec-independent protein translocase protein TatB
VFDNLGWGEILVLLLIGVFIFGPDKLPKAISDGVRMMRNLRDMARNATGDLNRQLGTNLELEDLHPKTFLRKHLLSEDDEMALRRPLENLYTDARRDVTGVRDDVEDVRASIEQGGPASGTRARPERPRTHGYDSDAT